MHMYGTVSFVSRTNTGFQPYRDAVQTRPSRGRTYQLFSLKNLLFRRGSESRQATTLAEQPNAIKKHCQTTHLHAFILLNLAWGETVTTLNLDAF